MVLELKCLCMVGGSLSELASHLHENGIYVSKIWARFSAYIVGGSKYKTWSEVS